MLGNPSGFLGPEAKAISNPLVSRNPNEIE
jgi:hypothetical protein